MVITVLSLQPSMHSGQLHATTMQRYLRETNGSECCGVTPKNEHSNLKMLGEIIVFRFDMKSLENKNAPCFTFSKSLKYPQIRCKSSTTSTIPTALRFQVPSSMCEIAIARCRRTRTPRVVGFRGWSFFSEPIVMAEAAIHSNVVICQVPYHPCMACLPTLTYMYHQHVPSRSSKCG